MNTARKLLVEMFLGETTVEVPDNWIEPFKKVMGSATRAGRLPKDSLQWVRDTPQIRRASDQGSPVKKSKPPGVATAPTVSSADSRSGRIIPATNRFKQQQGQSEPVSTDDEVPILKSPKTKSAAEPSGASALSRAWAALRGRDPENGLKKPKSASQKIHGRTGAATGLPRLDRVPDDNMNPPDDDAPYKSPFQGMGLDGDDSGDEDPVVKSIGRSLAKSRSKANVPDSEDNFDKDEVTDVDVHTPKTKGRHGQKESLGLLRQIFMDQSNRRY